MKKIIAVLTLVCSISLFFAQDVKIKKEVVLIDKQVVAKITKIGEQSIISNLSDGLSYKAAVKSKTPKGRETSQKWIELINKNDQIQELPLKLKSVNINLQKRMVENLVENEYITIKGINEAKYSLENTSITDELDRILDDFEKAYAQEDQVAADAKLVLEKPSEGFYPITADLVLIGYMDGKSRQDPTDSEKLISEYFVYDHNRQPVAILQFGSYDTGNELKPKYIITSSDGKEHPMITKCKFSLLNTEPMAIRMVKFLFANKYLIKETKK